MTMIPPGHRPAFDVERIRRRTSRSWRAGLRQAAGLSRQRRFGAEADGGARPHPAGLCGRIRQRPSRPALPVECRDRGLRGGAREGRGASSTPPHRGDHLHQATAPRRSTSSRPAGAATSSEGDEIVLSIMEHHSNIVPWHFLRERQGAVLKWVPVDDDGNFLSRNSRSCSPRTKIVAITQMSNVLGTVVPVKEVCASPMPAASRCWSMAARARCICRSTCRTSTATSMPSPATRLYGPTGIGVLYGKRSCWRDAAFNGGGEMIRDVPRLLRHLWRAAAPLRGRHAADRPGDRARRGDRLRGRHRPRRDRGA
jgi:hypothetical protein